MKHAVCLTQAHGTSETLLFSQHTTCDDNTSPKKHFIQNIGVLFWKKFNIEYLNPNTFEIFLKLYVKDIVNNMF